MKVRASSSPGRGENEGCSTCAVAWVPRCFIRPVRDPPLIPQSPVVCRVLEALWLIASFLLRFFFSFRVQVKEKKWFLLSLCINALHLENLFGSVQLSTGGYVQTLDKLTELIRIFWPVAKWTSFVLQNFWQNLHIYLALGKTSLKIPPCTCQHCWAHGSVL